MRVQFIYDMPAVLFISVLLIIAGIAVYVLILTQLVGSGISDTHDAPFLQSPSRIVQTIISQTHATQKSHIIELGCADGRVIRNFVRQTGARGTGIEISKPLLFIAKLYSLFDGTKHNITWLHQNIFDADLSHADIVYFFMTANFASSARLEQKINEELRPGAFVVSHWFEIPCLKHKQHAAVKKGTHTTYFYKI